MSLVGTIVSSAPLAGAATTAILTGSTTVGNSLVCWGYIQSGTAGSGYTGFALNDSGNTWTTRTSTTNAGRAVFAASAPITSGGIRTIVLTGSGGVGGMFGRLAVGEFTGANIVGDQLGFKAGVSAFPVTVNATGTNATSSDVVVVGIAVGNAGISTNISDPPTTGFSSAALNQNDATDSAGELAYRVNATVTTDVAQWTNGNFGTDGSASGVWSFKFGTTTASGPIPFYNNFQMLGVM